MPTEGISVRLPAELLRRLDAHVDQKRKAGEKVDRSAVIRQCLEAQLPEPGELFPDAVAVTLERKVREAKAYVITSAGRKVDPWEPDIGLTKPERRVLACLQKATKPLRPSAIDHTLGGGARRLALDDLERLGYIAATVELPTSS